MSKLVESLQLNKILDVPELKELLSTYAYDQELFDSALKIREKYYGRKIFIRGLIEISNFCKNDCYYCGIRCSNKQAKRFRLDVDDVLNCCQQGYPLGFRTFVLQGGEDPQWDDKKVCQVVDAIKTEYPDCAVTLSLGEKSRDSYQAYFDAGADRYLLRHETANEDHYRHLHPANMSLEVRKQCLWDLKEIGYAVGSGIMVGSPEQSLDNIIEDISFLQELNPDMIGIGPYLRHKDTPFRDCKDGDLDLTLRLLALFRHMFPQVLLPSTTALGTIHPKGREMGILAGANVVMPNISPEDAAANYQLYDNIKHTGAESGSGLNDLKARMAAIGFEIVQDRGDKANVQSED
ncbi:MAG: [FeFe] hydrogenase H-cluster radical SAM maturase HydE [Eubacterium sp.]|nr:[FeFe] hydrogenase H-cluster radical SAM maturase HydE [Candidatus Colimonas fimequi]